MRTREGIPSVWGALPDLTGSTTWNGVQAMSDRRMTDTTRRQGIRYKDGGQILEWADGCVSIPVRTMSLREHMTWHSALKVSRTMGVDEADDEMARRANNLEENADRAEYREGRYSDARDMVKAAMIFDLARRALI